jgi:hypothetical protein
MAADTGLLQGEVVEDPHNEKLDVERLLAGFLASLLREQAESTLPAQASPPAKESQ